MPSEFTYDGWMESQGIPVHRGYYVEDLRTVEVAPWELRGCDASSSSSAWKGSSKH